MALAISRIRNVSNDPLLEFASATGNLTSVGGLNYNYTSRGNDANQDLLLLKSFNDVHFYSTTGAVLYIRTRIEPDALYELTYTSSGGTANIDFVLQPNGANYNNAFAGSYRATQGANNSFDQASQTLSNFYFDHQFGGNGIRPTGKLIMYTGTGRTGNKRCMYFGGDTANVCWGYCRWVDGVPWEWAGTLNFNGDNKRAWIRRIG